MSRTIAQTHFGYAQFIIDYYHASEHIGELCCALFDRNQKYVETYRERWTDYLWEGKTLKPLWSKQPNGCPITPRRKKMPEHRLTTSIKIRTICDTVTIANKSYSSAQESLSLHVNILWAAGSSNPAWNGP